MLVFLHYFFLFIVGSPFNILVKLFRPESEGSERFLLWSYIFEITHPKRFYADLLLVLKFGGFVYILTGE